MTKPISTTVDWEAPDAEEPAGEQITKRGRHHMAELLAEKKLANAEQRAKYQKDYKGNIPPPEHQLSARTWKSSSRIRFPSERFRRNFSLINWAR